MKKSTTVLLGAFGGVVVGLLVVIIYLLARGTTTSSVVETSVAETTVAEMTTIEETTTVEETVVEETTTVEDTTTVEETTAVTAPTSPLEKYDISMGWATNLYKVAAKDNPYSAGSVDGKDFKGWIVVNPEYGDWVVELGYMLHDYMDTVNFIYVMDIELNKANKQENIVHFKTYTNDVGWEEHTETNLPIDPDFDGGTCGYDYMTVEEFEGQFNLDF